MLFANKGEQYPHLVAYLRETERLDLFKDFHQRWSKIVGLAAGIPFVFGLLFHASISTFLNLVVSGACGAVALYAMKMKKAAVCQN